MGTLAELGEVGGVVGLVLEELVDELNGLDAVVLAGGLGEVEVVELLGEQGLVEGPLGEGDAEPLAAGRGVHVGGVVVMTGAAGTREGRRAGNGGGAEEFSSVHGACGARGLRRGWWRGDQCAGAEPPPALAATCLGGWKNAARATAAATEATSGTRNRLLKSVLSPTLKVSWMSLGQM